MAENDGPKRTHHETRPENAERIQEALTHIAGEKMSGEKCRQHTVEVEIVPFDERAAGRGRDDEAQALLSFRSVAVTCRRGQSRHVFPRLILVERKLALWPGQDA